MFTSLLLVYLVKSPKKCLSVAFLYIFFICMLRRKGRHVRVFSSKHLSPLGREVKVTVLRFAHVVDFDFGWIGDRSSPTEVVENLILHSLSWLDLSPIHLKRKSMLGVECRKTLSSTARPRRANVICLVLLTNI